VAKNLQLSVVKYSLLYLHHINLICQDICSYRIQSINFLQPSRYKTRIQPKDFHCTFAINRSEPFISSQNLCWEFDTTSAPSVTSRKIAQSMASQPQNLIQSSELPPAQPDYVLRGHTAQIHCVHFLRQNSRLLTGDADGWVVLWNFAVKRPVAVWRAHGGSVLGVGSWGAGEENIITYVSLIAPIGLSSAADSSQTWSRQQAAGLAATRSR